MTHGILHVLRVLLLPAFVLLCAATALCMASAIGRFCDIPDAPSSRDSGSQVSVVRRTPRDAA